MVEKKEDKHTEEGIGIAGFVLGILSIIFFVGGAGIVIGIVGFFLCLYQQKRHPTRLGKIGLILNVIGFVIGLIFLIAYMVYLLPKMQEIIQQAQNFPVA
jgi:hypothetical protein